MNDEIRARYRARGRSWYLQRGLCPPGVVAVTVYVLVPLTLGAAYWLIARHLVSLL